MAALRADPAFLAGDIATEAEYYRIHYGTTLRDPELLDEVLSRLRAAFSAEGIVVARAIEDALYESTWARPDYDLIPGLRRLDIPTLLLHGDDDFVPLKVVREIADAILLSHLLVIPTCGHFAYLEHPTEVEAAITALLR
jgi:pimeloyl-ACP methyl ester carboxylesterase